MVDIPTEAVAEVRGLDELRLLIFPQPLGGALKNQNAAPSRVPIKQYLQKFPKWGRFGVTSVTPFLLLPVHPEGCTPAHRT